MDGGYYWEPGSIISGKMGGGEIQCDGLSSDVYQETLVVSLLCGGGSPFCMNKIFWLGQAVLADSSS